MSLEVKALLAASAVSLCALGLSFGAGVLLRATLPAPNQTQPNVAASATSKTEEPLNASRGLHGRTLFLKNCAHCHADDATGDEGPDLHGLTKSDDWIARRIRNGVKGEMTAFGEKFSQQDIDALIAYLRTLK